MQRAKQQHTERQDALLNPAPRGELLGERTVSMALLQSYLVM